MKELHWAAVVSFCYFPLMMNRLSWIFLNILHIKEDSTSASASALSNLSPHETMFHGETGMARCPEILVASSFLVWLRMNDAGAFAVPASNLHYTAQKDEDERGLRRCQLFVPHNFCFSLGLTFGSSILIGDTCWYTFSNATGPTERIILLGHSWSCSPARKDVGQP